MYLKSSKLTDVNESPYHLFYCVDAGSIIINYSLFHIIVDHRGNDVSRKACINCFQIHKFTPLMESHRCKQNLCLRWCSNPPPLDYHPDALTTTLLRQAIIEKQSNIIFYSYLFHSLLEFH
uniref:Uncharacterized protein n=1 Tax=Cacopsylla melanoneura TaxID=428564 RepID=A0A8D9EL37_9HEMI